MECQVQLPEEHLAVMMAVMAVMAVMGILMKMRMRMTPN